MVRATLFDITERRRYEQALLEARVHAERSSEQLLQVQNERLLRSNADLDSFVYAASHDLKQPVNNWLACLTSSSEPPFSTTPAPTSTKWCGMFDEALAAVLRTIDGLTEVVQLQRELAPVPPRPVRCMPW